MNKSFRSAIAIALMMIGATCSYANNTESMEELNYGDSTVVVKGALWENWFLQLGGDITLQKPYNHKFSDTFSKGTSLGVDVAVGKWFTKEMGLRAKINWENGIIDSKAEWLAPVNQPGVNHDKGGYLCVVGDIMFNLHNIIFGTPGGDDKPRVWNTMVFLRAGGVYNRGVSKGSPLIGVGWGNTFRLNDKWNIYADAAYNGVSSGFNGVGTGTGSGQNMFFNFDLGVQYNLGTQHSRQKDVFAAPDVENNLPEKTFWRNWYVQFGADMTLLNPYGKNFKNTFTRGRSFGIDAAIGKWFSPEIGMRGRVNLENCIIKNSNFEWLGYDEKKYTSNFNGGGSLLMYADMMMSPKHILGGYQRGEKWNMYVFGRMGLGRNRAVDSLSPLVGTGLGCTYRLNDKWSLYADTGYMGITSEYFSSDSTTGMGVPTGFNGIWDFHIGVQFNLGKFGW